MNDLVDDSYIKKEEKNTEISKETHTHTYKLKLKDAWYESRERPFAPKQQAPNDEI